VRETNWKAAQNQELVSERVTATVRKKLVEPKR
jgi:hypothetical protein